MASLFQGSDWLITALSHSNERHQGKQRWSESGGGRVIIWFIGRIHFIENIFSNDPLRTITYSLQLYLTNIFHYISYFYLQFILIPSHAKQALPPSRSVFRHVWILALRERSKDCCCSQFGAIGHEPRQEQSNFWPFLSHLFSWLCLTTTHCQLSYRIWTRCWREDKSHKKVVSIDIHLPHAFFIWKILGFLDLFSSWELDEPTK